MNIYKFFNNPQQLLGYSKRNIIVPQLAYEHVLKQGHRVPELETVIMKHSKWAYFYAVYIIKGRWFQAESYIKKHVSWWKAYTTMFYVNEYI